MDNEADREARAIGGLAGVAQADVVQLGAQSEVRKKTDIHAAAETIGELVGRAAAGSGGQTRPANQELRKGIEFGGVAQRRAGAEEIGVGVEGNAAGRGVVGGGRVAFPNGRYHVDAARGNWLGIRDRGEVSWGAMAGLVLTKSSGRKL